MGEAKVPMRLFITVITFILVLVFMSFTGIAISNNIASRVDEGRSVLNKIKKVEKPTFKEIDEFMKVTLSSKNKG